MPVLRVRLTLDEYLKESIDALLNARCGEAIEKIKTNTKFFWIREAGDTSTCKGKGLQDVKDSAFMTMLFEKAAQVPVLIAEIPIVFPRSRNLYRRLQTWSGH